MSYSKLEKDSIWKYYRDMRNMLKSFDQAKSSEYYMAMLKREEEIIKGDLQKYSNN